jgi:putative membrane protein insertion efficiency factor
MKKLLIKLIKMYQKIPGNFHYSCRFYPTCSNYAIDALNEYGTVKGSILSLWRIIRCNPLSKPGYDPIIKRSEKSEKDN